jgi:hypothetical protein
MKYIFKKIFLSIILSIGISLTLQAKLALYSLDILEFHYIIQLLNAKDIAGLSLKYKKLTAKDIQHVKKTLKKKGYLKKYIDEDLMYDMTILIEADMAIMVQKKARSILFYKNKDDAIEVLLTKNKVILAKHNTIKTIEKHIVIFLQGSHQSRIAVANITNNKMSNGRGKKLTSSDITQLKIHKILSKIMIKVASQSK